MCLIYSLPFFYKDSVNIWKRGHLTDFVEIDICCDVAVPRASAEFLPNRVRREIARTVSQSPERRFCYGLISNPIGFYFIFFWYERLSTEAIEAGEQLRHRSRREAMEDVGERERASTDRERRARNLSPEENRGQARDIRPEGDPLRER